MVKEDLEYIYKTMPNKEAAEKIGVSVPTLLKMVDSHGIKRKGSGRPYGYDENQIYISNVVTAIHKITKSLKASGLFHLIVTDPLFVKNNWNGLSSVSRYEFGEDNMQALEILKKDGIIGDYEIIDGNISTSVNNRECYVLTSEEYQKLEL